MRQRNVGTDDAVVGSARLMTNDSRGKELYHVWLIFLKNIFESLPPRSSTKRGMSNESYAEWIIVIVVAETTTKGFNLGFQKRGKFRFLQMPGSRCLAAPVTDKDGKKISWYFANRPSKAVPTGFNQEDTIKAIWAEDRSIAP